MRDGISAGELALPWRAFSDLPPWTATIRCGLHVVDLRSWRERVPIIANGKRRGETTMRRHELLDLCAAFELDRILYEDADRIVLWKVEHPQRVLPWDLLTDGAVGLRREDAPGEVSIGHVLDRLGLTLEGVRWDRTMTREVSCAVDEIVLVKLVRARVEQTPPAPAPRRVLGHV